MIENEDLYLSKHFWVYISLYIYTYMQIYVYTRSVQKLPSHGIQKIETFIEKGTRYKKYCTQDNDASVPFKVGTFRPHTILPITISCPMVFS